MEVDKLILKVIWKSKGLNGKNALKKMWRLKVPYVRNYKAVVM